MTPRELAELLYDALQVEFDLHVVDVAGDCQDVRLEGRANLVYVAEYILTDVEVTV
ncbi:MAG: hypothetical protein J2P17_06180 [Mycobacterium sp.]|nr:hypothetical protein [Mycobacterium sp.]